MTERSARREGVAAVVLIRDSVCSPSLILYGVSS